MTLRDIFQGPLSPAKWRALGEYLSSSGIRAGKGTMVRQVGNQHVISVRRQPDILADVLPFQVYDISKSGETWKAKVKTGLVITFDPLGMASVTRIDPTNVDADITVSDSLALYCKVTTDKNDLPGSAEIIAAAADPADTHAQPDPSGNTGVYHYKLADFEIEDEVLKVKRIYHLGGAIVHRPGRNERNAKIIIEQKSLHPDGYLEAAGSDEYMFFRQGLYVGTVDPGDYATEDVRTFTHLVSAS